MHGRVAAPTRMSAEARGTPAGDSAARPAFSEPRTCDADPAVLEPCESCHARCHSVCAGLSVEEINRLALLTQPATIGAGQTFISEGESAVHLINLNSGCVKIFKLLPDGRRQITGFLFQGDFLGIPFNEAYVYSAEAVTDVQVCRFPRRAFNALMEEIPGLEKRLLTRASNELAQAQEQMLLLGRKTAREKIASFLLGLSERARRLGLPDDPVDLPMGRADIADYLGLTTETVSRTLTQLKRDQLIRMEGTAHVRLLDRAELIAISDGE
ncbi:MAG: helix-turn-helix domain-containing protein [Alphaproteobacteria bacterium]|nr:helix-turn-helix domain-containing protein [Alphaproteobacteria bacterium]